jgi:hypothetical protein
MDVAEQHQLREWARRLSGVQDAERRAMGRAIAMLLDRIDELERELTSAAAEPAPETGPSAAAFSQPVSVGEDTEQLSLRDRLRLATDHLRDRRDDDRG